MIPRGFDRRRLLVVVDVSWWLNMAFHAAGLEGMTPIVVGKFVDLLRGEAPEFLGVAVDSVGPTWRHELTEHMQPEWQYKGGREPKPPEFFTISRRILDIISMHRIPLLYAEGWEADDVFAAVKPYAMASGLNYVILSEDKDLASLVGDGCYLWDGKMRVRGPAEVETSPRHPVPPRMVSDLLAITGDSGDNIPGVKGMGPKTAAAILRRYGSLRAALDAAPSPVAPEAIKAAERERAKAKRTGAGLAEAQARLDALREERDVATAHLRLLVDRDAVELSQKLTTLDANAPIRFDLRELAIGDYDVPALRKAYTSLGFSHIASEVEWFPKAEPFADEAVPQEPLDDEYYEDAPAFY